MLLNDPFLIKRHILTSIFSLSSQIDTLAAEYPAMTNYLYCTYHGQVCDLCSRRKERMSQANQFTVKRNTL